MKCLISLFFLLFSFTISAREKEIEVNSRKAQVGFYSDNTPVTGIVFDLPGRIHRFYLDTARNEMVLTFKIPETFTTPPSARVMVIDLNTNQVKWSKETLMLGFATSNDCILLSGNNTAFCYDKGTGKRKWARPEHSDIRYVDKAKNIAYSSYVGAINISTGKAIWNKQIFTNDHWDEIKYLDDTTLLVTSAGLHCFNTKNGKGWHYAGVTEKEDATILSVLPLAVGLTGGLIGLAVMGSGVFSIPMGGTTYTHGLCSQIIAEQRIVYLATKKELFAVNADNGNKLWTVDLPAKKTSQSMLYSLGTELVLLNKGLVNKSDGRSMKLGDPYLLASNKLNGRQKYMVDLSAYGPVFDSYIAHDTLLLLFSKNILKYDLSTGRKISEQKIGSDSMIYYHFIDPSKGYLLSASGTCTNLADLYPAGKFINTSSDSIIVYNGRFEEPLYIKKDGLLREYANEGDLHILATDRSTILMKDNKEIAEIMLLNPGRYYNKKMYFIEGVNLYAIDISAP